MTDVTPPEEPDAIVRRLGSEIQAIEGVVRLLVTADRVWVVVDDPARKPPVRRALLDLGVPDALLELHAATDLLFPHPSDTPPPDL